MTPGILSCSTLTGDQVVDSEGDKLGTLKDIMVDLTEGKVAYAVLARGGFGGMGEKLFAVPWRMLEVDGDNRRLMLDVDPAVLEDSPGFDPDNWPSFTDEAWQADVDRHFGLVP